MVWKLEDYQRLWQGGMSGGLNRSLRNEATDQEEALQPAFDHAGAGQEICV